MEIQQYLLHKDKKILDALKKIDLNEKGFVVIIGERQTIVGTVTDGDIRRRLILGGKLTDCIDTVVNHTFKYLLLGDPFEKVVKLFKNSNVHFLPIIDEQKVVVNIITKKQLHILMLEDSKWDYLQDFKLLDENRLEYEVYNRPWGYYKTVFLSDFARAKVITVYPNGKLSLQEHKFREEHWVIVKGEGVLTIGESVKTLNSGSYVYIPKGCIHTIENTSSSESLFISEVQLGTYFGEDDIIRYSDIYGRV
ncbi:CBS domain-containing protein [Viridibacillus arvi]|uniref:CBS domain-containing protein n=1 Tax=Viridibacillus arvi TaxID=263475 RepID=UPI003D053B70